MCSLAVLAKEATFLAIGTIWVLVGERQPQVAVLLPGVPWQAEQMEVMEMITPIRSDKRWPNSPSGVVGNDAGLFDRWKGSHDNFYFPPLGLASLAPA